MIKILECNPEHTEQITAIGRETFYDTFHARNRPETMSAYLDTAFSPDKIRGEIENPDSRFFLLREEEKNIAWFKINFYPSQTDLNDPEALELERLYVRKQYKGRGLGKMMVAKTEETAIAHRLKYVWLGVWEKNEPAIAFYKEMGFTHYKTHFFHIGDEDQTDYIMRKELHQ